MERGDEILPLSLHGGIVLEGLSSRAVDLRAGVPEPAELAGVDTVFHLAGIAHRNAPDADYAQLNTAATLALAEASAAAGVRCFIFLSSVKAMGAPAGDAPRGEGDVAPPQDAYGRSKWRAECALRNAFADSPLSVVILRPALVYGPGVKGNLQLLARAIDRGLPRPPEGGRRSLIAVGDLVDLLCAVADRAPAGVNTWVAAGDEAYSSRELYDLLRTAGGDPPGRAWLPRPAWRAGLRAMDALRRVRGGHGARGESSWDKLFAAERYSSAAVQTATGWQPRRRFADMAAGMRGGAVR